METPTASLTQQMGPTALFMPVFPSASANSRPSRCGRCRFPSGVIFTAKRVGNGCAEADTENWYQSKLGLGGAFGAFGEAASF